MNSMKYTIIDQSRSSDIAKLTVCLTSEIVERTGLKAFDIDESLVSILCENYVSNGIYTVIAAFDEEKIIGFGSLCESHSLYTEGAFGIIQELYVMPDYRSQNIGQTLIHEMVGFAKSREWKRLELCTPPLPEFERSVEFYQDNGFERTGGYKMKFIIE